MSSEKTRGAILLFLMPPFFYSNIVIGRAVIADVPPFTLAFFRWALAAAMVLPIAWAGIMAARAIWRSAAPQLFLLGFLGMWICGAVVYLSLQVTTATNATLIYTTSPVFVILIEAIFRGRRIGWPELVGIPLAVAGVAAIVTKGDVATLFALSFNLGDLGILICAFAWAVYTVVLKDKVFKGIGTMPLFAAIATCGALVLLPFMVVESARIGGFPTSARAWIAILALATVSSILAFSSYQYGVKVFGPTITSIVLYVMPVYGVGLAILVLGEALRTYHLVGIGLVLLGLVLATFPRDLAARILPRLRHPAE
jgi:drug/metabolite transporter (DMT)-like permease